MGRDALNRNGRCPSSAGYARRRPRAVECVCVACRDVRSERPSPRPTVGPRMGHIIRARHGTYQTGPDQRSVGRAAVQRGFRAHRLCKIHSTTHFARCRLSKLVSLTRLSHVRRWVPQVGSLAWADPVSGMVCVICSDVNIQDGSLRRRASNAAVAALTVSDAPEFIWRGGTDGSAARL